MPPSRPHFTWVSTGPAFDRAWNMLNQYLETKLTMATRYYLEALKCCPIPYTWNIIDEPSHHLAPGRLY
jgi:hypothetical protein